MSEVNATELHLLNEVLGAADAYLNRDRPDKYRDLEFKAVGAIKSVKDYRAALFAQAPLKSPESETGPAPKPQPKAKAARVAKAKTDAPVVEVAKEPVEA